MQYDKIDHKSTEVKEKRMPVIIIASKHFIPDSNVTSELTVSQKFVSTLREAENEIETFLKVLMKYIIHKQYHSDDDWFPRFNGINRWDCSIPSVDDSKLIICSIILEK
jgi:hypothetical protein